MDVGGSRGLFTTGRCALTMDWGDVGTLAPGTYAQDKTGATITPGWKQVLDRATGKLVPCDATTCPNAVDGVNYAPFGSFGGWSGAVNAKAPKAQQDAAYDFLSYMSAPAQSGRRRDARQDRLQPVPDLPVHEQGPVARRRPEPGRDRQLPRRHQDEPREQELRPRPADPADQAVRAGRARHGRRRSTLPRSSTRPAPSRPSPMAGTPSPTRSARTSSSLPMSRVLASRSSSSRPRSRGAGPVGAGSPSRCHAPGDRRRSAPGARTARPDGCSSGRPSSSSSSCRSSRSSRRSRCRVSKLVFRPGGVDLDFIGFSNYQQLLFGLERSHFLGVLKTPNPIGWAILDRDGRADRRWPGSGPSGAAGSGPFGLVLRLVGGVVLFVGFVWLLVQTLLERRRPARGARRHRSSSSSPGSSSSTASAWGSRCWPSSRCPWRRFFRIVFLIPLTITPVGVGYMFLMMTDTSKGPARAALGRARAAQLHVGHRPVAGPPRRDHRRHVAVDAVRVHRPAGRAREPRPGGPRGRPGGWCEPLAELPPHHRAGDPAGHARRSSSSGSSRASRSSTCRTSCSAAGPGRPPSR